MVIPALGPVSVIEKVSFPSTNTSCTRVTLMLAVEPLAGMVTVPFASTKSVPAVAEMAVTVKGAETPTSVISPEVSSTGVSDTPSELPLVALVKLIRGGLSLSTMVWVKSVKPVRRLPLMGSERRTIIVWLGSSIRSSVMFIEMVVCEDPLGMMATPAPST